MQRKLNQLLIALVFVGVITAGLFANDLLKKNYMNGINEKLITSSSLILLYIEENKDENKIESYINNVSKEINLRVTIIESDGKVSHDSDYKEGVNNLDNHKSREEIIKAFSGKIGMSKRFSETLKKELYYIALPSIKDGNVEKIVRLSLPLESINNYNSNLIKQLIISIIWGVLVAQLLGSRFISTIVKPIVELNKATKKIAFGNLHEKVYINSNDELGEIAQNFNIMSSQLEKKIREMNNNAEEMDSILSSMLNGVIALDNSKNIMFINPSAEELFHITEARVTGKNILSVLKNNELDEKIEALLTSSTTSKIEIEIYEPKHRTLNLYTNTITSENEKLGVLIIIDDITEIRKLENMRKDFVANVSHELKTPLTSIRGFVETLKNGAVENKEVRTKFLDIIDLETIRLSSLIEDLLVLSEIENEKNVNKANVSIEEALKDISGMLKNLASMKRIKFEIEIEEYMPDIYGNKSWLKQMLINLIDNAIKYTNEDGYVKLSIYSEDDFITISVKDNGVGILKDHTERIFERFYRVDKARSRNVGGTGLGLAIVKHVILSFDGHIQVNSDLGQGSEFIVSIPISRVFK